MMQREMRIEQFEKELKREVKSGDSNVPLVELIKRKALRQETNRAARAHLEATLESKTAQEIIDQQLKAVVLNESTYRNNILDLDQAYWALQIDVPNERDFGMVKFDFRQVKDQLLRKIEGLRTKLRAEVLAVFKGQLTLLTEALEEIEYKLSAKYETIDEIISQIEYIETMATHGHVLEEMRDKIFLLVEQKRFLDGVAVKLPEEPFGKYLKLHKYPADLEALIKVKIKTVPAEKRRITEILMCDGLEVNDEIAHCQETIKDFTTRGL
jgi:hypothetical protein